MENREVDVSYILKRDIFDFMDWLKTYYNDYDVIDLKIIDFRKECFEALIIYWRPIYNEK